MRSRGLVGVAKPGGRACGVLGAGMLVLGVLAVWGAAPAVAEQRQPTAYPVGGLPVKGSTQGCADAPVLRPGRYLDALAGEKDLWYRVEKRPEQVLELSATAVQTGAVYGTSDLTIGAGWAEGDEPKSWLTKTDMAAGNAGVVSVGARSGDKADGQTQGCVHIDNGFRPMDPTAPPTPLELVVGLLDKKAAAGSGAGAAPAAGDGFSFAGARAVPAPGTPIRANLAIGEFPFYRVDVKDGQKLTVRAAVDHPASLAAGPLATWTVQVYNVLRAPMRCPVKVGD
ncbi:MAG: hypothetical protein HOV68_24640, partial [Streptomycetaceae bacterium]|nr:hypothetical protein [Streptomycetaceae bacterium]